MTGCMAFAKGQCPSVCTWYWKHCRQLVARAGQQWKNTSVSGCCCNYLFAKKRLEAHRKSGKVKAPASEILTIYQFYNISARPLGPKPLARWLARLSFPNAISLTCWSACPMEVFQDASWTKQPKCATSCLMKLGGLIQNQKNSLDDALW